MCGLLLLFINMLLIRVITPDTITDPDADEKERNAFYQYLPKCSNGYDRIQKQTQAKAILCPMFRDEEGFLSEWVAYYQMHGFDHIIMFDDGSTDNSLIEMKPWIDSGFVSVRSNWTVDGLGIDSSYYAQPKFYQAMTIKNALERSCKQQAVDWGYDFYFSLDIDEYIMPSLPNVTIVDSLDGLRKISERSLYCLDKLNFIQAPHTLEPVHLLTIEAYQHRNYRPSQMSYYSKVSPKCGVFLKQPSQAALTYILDCCNFHGCSSKGRGCGRHDPEEVWTIIKGNRKWMKIGFINHYSRSLEKYAQKSKTWRTARGEGEGGATAYDIPGFLVRNVGWRRDNTALRYTCQLREQLRKMTGEDIYLRPGNVWYRNAEFGKHIGDPDKRGRYGRPNPEGYIYKDGNPYHYHGEEYKESHLHIDKPPRDT